MYRKRILLTVVNFVLICGTAGNLALAQSDQEATVFEEVMVTATKRASTIKDVPFSINAQTQADIERSGATNLEELSRNVAGLTVQNLGPGQSQVAIRGVSAGQIVRDQPGVKEQVGVYLDESVISLSLFTPDLDLYDLNRVETLRGPQGTLFGSGSVGGTIRYITNQPNLESSEGSFEANINTVTDGDVGGSIKGMYNAPFADGTAALRIVGYYTEYAGYIDALGEGGSRKDDVNDGSRVGVRAAITWEPNDNVVITPRLIYQEISTDGFNRQEVFNLFANPHTTTRTPIQLGEREQYLLLDEGFNDDTLILDLTAQVAFDSFDATFVTSYTDRDILVSRDASALTGSVSVDLGYPEAAVTLPSNLLDATAVEQFTTELRFSSNNDGPWQWLAGVFYSDTDREYSQRLPTPGYAAFTDAVLGAGTSAAVANGFPNLDSPFNSDLPYSLQQFAIFGEITFDINERTHLTAGGRFYDYDEKRFISSGGLFANGDSMTFDETSADGFTPRVMLSYDYSDDVTFNAQASQGFRLGGVNDPLNANLCTPADRQIFGSFQSYEDETLWNYEVGVKAVFNDNVTFNTAVFFADISDLQVTLDAGSCSSRISFNVPEAHSTGIEFELDVQATDDFNFSIAGSVLESEFDSTVIDATGSILGGVADGNRLPSVPEFQVAATATYELQRGFIEGSESWLSATFHYIDSRFTQPSDQVAGAGNFSSGLPFGGATGNEVTSLNLDLPDYSILNLNYGMAKDSWEAVLYVNNLTDENADTSFDRERGGRARLGFRTNTPRTFGVIYRMRY